MARSYYDFGTAAGISIKNAVGTLPSPTFRAGHVDPIEELTSEYWNGSGRLTGKAGCGACIYSCHRHVRIPEGPFAGTYSGGPEYETVCALGTGTGIRSLGALQRANALCNDLGLDTISTGTVIQWAMESAERGLLGKDAGLDLRFGSEEAVTELPLRIAFREGIGDLLAEGMRVASARVGGDSWKWAMQARGLEQSGVETRCTMAYALAFAVNPRGPDHLHTECLAERGNTPEARDLIERITGSR
jgi:aldehyde:ferredoxin oxidoreductase